jgi:hypothetical protein
MHDTFHSRCSWPIQDDNSLWPSDAKTMMSKAEDMFPKLVDRRKIPRIRYRVQAMAKIVEPTKEQAMLYTRDVNPWSAGFVCDRPIPQRARITIELPLPDGRVVALEGMVMRCREFSPGCFEGSVDFQIEHPELASLPKHPRKADKPVYRDLN